MFEFLNDKRFKYKLILILVILISTPYLIAYFNTPKNYTFTGFVFGTIDNYTYISKMSNAERGWVFLNNYSYGNNYGGYHFLFYILLGKMSILFNIPYILMFHISRLILAVIFVIVLYDLLNIIGVVDIRKQNIVVCVTLFTGNFQWLNDIVSLIMNTNVQNGYLCPELIPQLTLLYIPHFILNMIFLMKIIKYTVLYKNNRIKNGTVISIYLLASALVHPFSAVSFGVYSGSYIFLQDIINKRANIKNFLLLFILALAPLPYLSYSLYAFTHYETLIEWNKQAIVTLGSFHSRLYIQGIFCIIPYILVLIKANWKKDRSVITWFMTLALCLTHLPFRCSLRFLEGVGLCSIVLLGLLIYEKFNIPKFIKVGLIFFLLFNSIWLAIEPIFFNTSTISVYISNKNVEVQQYIKKNVSYNDLILCDYNTGVHLPAYTGNRVVLGHHHESEEVYKWIDIWIRLWRSGDVSELKKYKISYYLVNKNTNYPHKPPTKDCHIVFENAEYILYKISDK